MAISIAAAQAALLSGGDLDTIGQQRDDAGVSLAATDAAVIRLASKFVQDASDNLNRVDRQSSGKLERSIVPEVVEFGGGISVINIMVAFYYKFVNKGVKGLRGGSSKAGYKFRTPNPSRKMVAAIKEWISREGNAFRNTKVAVTTREKKRGKMADMATRNAWLAARAIKRKGLQPTSFWDDAIVELEKDIATGIAEALRIDVIENVKV